MSESIAIVGAGISGMCTALALSKDDHQITLFERDVAPPQGHPDTAFFDWQRRGAAQFRHPHAFLGLMCSILEEHHPALLEDFFAAGARRVDFADMVPPHLMDQYQPLPGDEKMWVLMCRRATMETGLRRYVERHNNITIHNKTYVTGLVTESGETLKATGLELTDRSCDNKKSVFHADIIIDATGRASKFPQWLRQLGIEVEEQRDDAEIVYYTRHYQLRDGVEEPKRHENERSAGDLGYLKYGVFPGDGGHFAVIVCVPNNERELRAAIKDGEQFVTICREIPGLVPWLAPDKATPTTPSFGIGEIHAVWRNFIQQDRAQIHGFFAVGDAAVRTNPLYGRGCSTGILHAHLLAGVLAKETDAEQRAVSFETLTHERIRPIFDASLSEDKNGIRRAAAVMNNQSLDQANNLKGWFRLAFGDALAAAAKHDMHVFRGMMRTVNLLEKPGAFLQDSQTKRTVLRYMLRGRKRNAAARVQRGPQRAEMLRLVEQLNA